MWLEGIGDFMTCLGVVFKIGDCKLHIMRITSTT